MSSTIDEADPGRRRLLSAAATIVGAVGVGFAAVPFLASWSPSEKAQAAGAPVEVDISKLEPGARITVEWRGKPVWVVNRNDTMLDSLNSLKGELRDPDSAESVQPDYAKNETRSLKPGLLVMVGLCTHLGCSPSFRPEPAPADLGPTWQGGFFCPCHGSKFDLAGRVYKGVPAPTNMDIPPYMFLDDTRILVGIDKSEAA